MKCPARVGQSLALLALIGPALLPFGITEVQAATDIDPPQIVLQNISDGIAGEAQRFSAEVRDQSPMRDVRLYYRFAGESAYISQDMEALGNSLLYETVLSTTPGDTRAIEYYIQARDAIGYRAVSGYAFEPHVRWLQTPPARTTPATPPGQQMETAPARNRPEAARTPRNYSTLWQIGGGLLALVAIGSLVSSGGDDSPSSNTGTVPLTIQLGGPSQ